MWSIGLGPTWGTGNDGDGLCVLLGPDTKIGHWSDAELSSNGMLGPSSNAAWREGYILEIPAFLRHTRASLYGLLNTTFSNTTVLR